MQLRADIRFQQTNNSLPISAVTRIFSPPPLGQPTPDLHLSSLEAPEYLGQIIFPESMLTATLTNFKKEFKEQNQRTLFFTAHLGHGEIQYQNILFVVSTAQMIILDLFNGKEPTHAFFQFLISFR